jgi:hypothetical protein
LTPRQTLALGLTLTGLGAILVVAALGRRVASVATPSEPDEEPVTVPIPSGWQRLSSSAVTPELGQAARSILAAHSGDPYGTLVPFTASDGQQYAGLIEQHYHPPGGAAKPWGYHTGVTLLVTV